MRKRIHEQVLRFLVPITFLIMGIIAFLGADVSFKFLQRELFFRFIANGMTILALLIPIYAGMGLNFSLVLGVIASQAAVVIVVDQMIPGSIGILSIVVLSIGLSVIIGSIIGYILNRTKGKEMITSIVIGFVGSSIYQMVFMVLYGKVIIPRNQEILLSNGMGVRNMIDIYPYKMILDEYKWFPVLTTILCAVLISLLMRTKLGNKIRAVGQDGQLALNLGISTDRIRQIAIILSTVIASLGHLLYMFSMGNVNVYSGHLSLDVFACAALLAGGATLKNASILNAFLGLFLFHTLFILSPLAAQNYFANIAIGEYFRSFIAYGVVVIAFMINLKNSDEIKVL